MSGDAALMGGGFLVTFGIYSYDAVTGVAAGVVAGTLLGLSFALPRAMPAIQGLLNAWLEYKKTSEANALAASVERERQLGTGILKKLDEAEKKLEEAERERVSLREVVNRIDRRTAAPNRVLVVEDDPATSKVYLGLLGHAGYECEAADTLAAARIVIEGKAPPSWIFLDYMLPDGYGLDLLREVRHKRLDIRVAFITAHEDALIEADRKSADIILLKSAIDWAALVAKMKALTDKTPRPTQTEVDMARQSGDGIPVAAKPGGSS